MATTGRFQNTP